MKRLCALVVAAVMAGLLTSVVVSAPAEASRDGRPWPTRKITYFDASLDPGPVAYAVALWNRSGLKVKFKKVTSKRKAQLLIQNKPKRTPQGCGSGRAELGYNPRGGKSHVWIAHATGTEGQRCSFYGQAQVVTHELGHVLGLGHDTKHCSLMNTSIVNGVGGGLCVNSADPVASAAGRWLCNPLQVTDLKHARRLYGGKIKPAPAFCDIVARMPATGALTIAVDRNRGNYAFATLVRLPEPAVPAELAGNVMTPAYEIHRTAGACTAVPGDNSTVVNRNPWTVAPGGTEQILAGTSPVGPMCWTAFAIDSLGRYALVGSSVTGTVSALTAQQNARTAVPAEPTVQPRPKPVLQSVG